MKQPPGIDVDQTPFPTGALCGVLFPGLIQDKDDISGA